MSTRVKNRAQQNRSAPAQQAAKVKSYVNHQLEKTRKQVRTVDLISGFIVLVAFTVGFLLLCAMVDAWIWPLPTFARWICLAILLVGIVGYTVLSIVPLFLKKINLDYVAKMIEEAKPDFQNSLLNYVSFRKKPIGIRPAVFDAVSRQAATDLASVPGEAAVDQSKLIRLGFILIGITFAAVCYTVFSPKSPLQTVARIFSPGGKIAKPAVVQIVDVDPGDARIFFGDDQEVTATVRGSHRPEDVKLIYSTIDGQIVDRTLSMEPIENIKNQYRVQLAVSGSGIQQSLRYHVVARDGTSPEYEITVQPNPSIAVESIVISPPAYTGLEARTLTGQGDVEALEGSMVTVNALANMQIKEAKLEFLEEIVDPEATDGEISLETKYRTAAHTILLTPDGKTASGRFQATLDPSGEKSFATHYRLHFQSTDGNYNRKQNVYPIRVIPDLAPEIRFRSPVEANVEVPENGVLAVDIEASDLDFLIKSVKLNISHQASQILSQKLKLNSKDGNRRTTSRYLIRPKALGLKAGDQAVFFATAADNRVSWQSDQPDPNISRTDNYSLTVVEADESIKNEDQNDDGEGDGEKGEDENKNDGESGDEGEGGEGGQGASGDEGDGDSTGGGEGEDGGDGGGDQSEDGGEGGGGSESKGEGAGQDGGENKDGKSAGGGEQSEDGGQDSGSGANSNDNMDQNAGNQTGNGENGGDQKENPGEHGDGGQSGSQNRNTNNDSTSPKDGGSTNEQGDSTNQPDSGSNTGDSSSDGTQNPQRQPGENGQPGGEDQPDRQDDSLTEGDKETMRDDATDGERIREMQEHFGDDADPSKGGDQNTGDGESGNEQNPEAGDQGNPDGNSGDDESGKSAASKSADQGDQGKGESGDSKGQSEDKTGDGGDQEKGKAGEQQGDQEGKAGEKGGDKGGEKGGDKGGEKGGDKGGEKGGDKGGEKGGDKGGEKGGDKGGEKGGDKGGEKGGGNQDGKAGQEGGDKQPGDGHSQSDKPGKSTTNSAPGGTGNASQVQDDLVEREKTNLEHAKKTTDLILKKLSEQQNNPDPELLKKMNWTQDDLKDFVNRWDELKGRAQNGNAADQRKYEQHLKSLGLRPTGGTTTNKQIKNNIQGLGQDGAVNKIADELKPGYNSFLRGLNRSK